MKSFSRLYHGKDFLNVMKDDIMVPLIPFHYRKVIFGNKIFNTVAARNMSKIQNIISFLRFNLYKEARTAPVQCLHVFSDRCCPNSRVKVKEAVSNLFPTKI